MTGGNLTIGSNALRMGELAGGHGTFLQSGGTFQASRLYIGLGDGSQGDYTLSGTGQLQVSVDAYVGWQGEGTFTMTGGSLDVAGDLRISEGSGTQGVFAHSAGTVHVNRLVMSRNVNSDASYLLSGTAHVDVDGNVYAGFGSTGLIEQTGGTMQMNGAILYLSNVSAGQGTYQLKGGLLDLGGGVVDFGPGNGQFEFTGGTLKNVDSFGGTLVQTDADDPSLLAPGASVGTMSIDGDYDLQGGAYEVEIDSSGNDFLDVAGMATLNGDLQIHLLGGFQPLLGSTYDVLQASEIDLGVDFALDPIDFTPGTPRMAAEIVAGQGVEILRLTAVPEPNSLALLLAGCLGAIAVGGRRARGGRA
jgi:T5SS/PEP-CTERM-associated repeat protein